ncbi:unnamed protein product [Mycena citricolor]|uniref:Uncharacterized protein n=1 Tax=Mycena citricolor TaxID=2018698 RepID=A0AAD2GT26_9AGAR|nr:unnamed protein product [Mycena citricolor]
MLLLPASLLVLLAAPATMAVPTSTERLNARMARRGLPPVSTHARPILADVPSIHGPRLDARTPSKTPNTTYSHNWAGVVVEAANGTFQSVSGSFIVPNLADGPAKTDNSASSAWVGIDGTICETAILQTGIDFYWSPYFPNHVDMYPWYEYWPGFEADWYDVTVNIGDAVTVNATVTSASSGTVSLVNHSQGWVRTQDLIAPPDSPLCQSGAEWIVEAVGSDLGLVAFANFDVVHFTDATAFTAAGGVVGPGSATSIYEIRQDSGLLLTETSYNAHSARIQYVGDRNITIPNGPGVLPGQ